MYIVKGLYRYYSQYSSLDIYKWNENEFLVA
jgi:hypothetical protein